MFQSSISIIVSAPMNGANGNICPLCTVGFFTILNDFDACFICKLYLDIYFQFSLDFHTFVLKKLDLLAANKDVRMGGETI